MNKSNKCSSEVRERAVRMVQEHRRGSTPFHQVCGGQFGVILYADVDPGVDGGCVS